MGRATKVLLIDDSDSNRMVLGCLLEDEGLEVDLAASCSQAREKLCAEGASYDLILLDQHLGDGLGTSLVPTARARMPAAKVMLISGSAEEVPADAGLDAAVEKGRDVDDIVALMRTLLPWEKKGPA